MMDKLNWQGFSGVKRCLWAAGLSLGLGAGLPGCVAHARGEMVYESPNSYSDDYVYPTDYVTVVPARIEYYPHTYYQGRPAYLVDGRWYYRNHERWVVFREEPTHLREYRLQGADHGRSVHSNYPRYAAGQRLIEQRRQEQRRQEQREQQQRAERHRQEQAHEQARRAEQHRQDQERRHEQRPAEHGPADHRTAERRRADRERERDRAEQERRPKQHGRRDQRDDRRDD